MSKKTKMPATQPLVIELANPNKFCAILEAVTLVNDSVIIKCYPEQICIKAIDKAKISFVDLQLENDSFSSYSIGSHLGTCVDIGINIKLLVNIIKIAAKDSAYVRLSYPVGSDKLIVDNDDSGTDRKHFELALKNIVGDDLGEISDEFTSTIELESKKFQSYISELAVFANDFIFNHADNMFTISVKGDAGDGFIRTPVDDVAGENITLILSMTYMQNIASMTRLATKATICMAPTLPLMIHLTMDEKTAACGTFRVYLAPKQED